jgi:hypothetical protein
MAALLPGAVMHQTGAACVQEFHCRQRRGMPFTNYPCKPSALFRSRLKRHGSEQFEGCAHSCVGKEAAGGERCDHSTDVAWNRDKRHPVVWPEADRSLQESAMLF